MNVDVRKAIALLFAVIGVLLVYQGIAEPPSAADAVHRININLWWGSVMLLFAVALFGLARYTANRK